MNTATEELMSITNGELFLFEVLNSIDTTYNNQPATDLVLQLTNHPTKPDLIEEQTIHIGKPVNKSWNNVDIKSGIKYTGQMLAHDTHNSIMLILHGVHNPDKYTETTVEVRQTDRSNIRDLPAGTYIAKILVEGSFLLVLVNEAVYKIPVLKEFKNSTISDRVRITIRHTTKRGFMTMDETHRPLTEDEIAYIKQAQPVNVRNKYSTLTDTAAEMEEINELLAEVEETYSVTEQLTSAIEVGSKWTDDDKYIQQVTAVEPLQEGNLVWFSWGGSVRYSTEEDFLLEHSPYEPKWYDSLTDTGYLCKHIPNGPVTIITSESEEDLSMFQPLTKAEALVMVCPEHLLPEQPMLDEVTLKFCETDYADKLKELVDNGYATHSRTDYEHTLEKLPF